MDERIRMLDGPYRRVYASANDAVCSVLPNFAAANENLQRQLQRGSNFGPCIDSSPVGLLLVSHFN